MNDSRNGTLLEVEDLRTYFYLEEGVLKAVDGVNLSVRKGTTFGIVGESGCGKSITALSILRILLRNSKHEGGSIKLHVPAERSPSGEASVLELDKMHSQSEEIRRVRGNLMSMIFQEPMSALSPVHTVGDQLMEIARLHLGQSEEEARETSINLLKRVGISAPVQRMQEYPHQLSGGMAQRVMTAMALIGNPLLLIADEPTTALDVTVQAQILELMQNLQTQYGMSIIFITHDLGVIAQMADEVAVMYLGHIVEYADVDSLFYRPAHPYTRALMAAVPRPELGKSVRLAAIPGRVPQPINMPEACPFVDRCPYHIPGTCDKRMPPEYQVEEGHWTRCFLYDPEVKR